MRVASILVLVQGATAIGVIPCSSGPPAQVQWSFNSTLAAADGSGCLALVECAPAQLGAVFIEPCGNNRCPGNTQQQWTLSPGSGFFSSAADTTLCLTLIGVSGPGVNLWPCSQGKVRSPQT